MNNSLAFPNGGLSPSSPFATALSFGLVPGSPGASGSMNTAFPVVPAPAVARATVPSVNVSAGSTGVTAPTAGTGAGAEVTPFSWNDAIKGTFLNDEGGLNLGNIGSLAQTIGAFGQIWSGIQANKVARDSLSFQKNAFNTNMANQISTFNMSLEDRARARAAQNGQSEGDMQAFIDKHSL